MRVFISYRRSDCQAQANGLYDGLRHRLDSANIFMDIDSIPPGVDFEQHIREEIEVCDLVLVLVGDDWLAPRPGTSSRRIDEPDDFVRLEIESALESSRVRVVPVLVEGAQMPRAADLPVSIRGLARINAIELSDRRWISDLQRLTAMVEDIGRDQRDRAHRTSLAAADAERSQQGSAPQRNMRLADVDEQAVMTAVESMQDTFRTKDISEDPRVRSAHATVSGLRNYHTMIGRHLAKNHVALGLLPAEAAIDARGAIWRKESPPQHQFLTNATPASTQVRSSVAVAPSAPEASNVPESGRDRTSLIGWLMVAIPMLTIGLAAFVPALWAAAKRRQDRAFRRRMFAFAGAIGAITILGLVLLVSSPADAEGAPSGTQSDIGGFMWVGGTLMATVVAVVHRKPRTSKANAGAAELPGMAQELARRRQRDQYRALVDSDLNLARSMGVGRPDQERDYSDGGLLDLNNLSAEQLSRFGQLPVDEAERIVDVRERLGSLASVDEVINFANLTEGTASRLRQTAVFL